MGSIVVQKDPFGANWQIIDGQQRLVTMYLFYLALAQAAKEHGAEGSALSDQLCITILGEEPKLISDCPSGVARPAKQPEFQLVLHQG